MNIGGILNGRVEMNLTCLFPIVFLVTTQISLSQFARLGDSKKKKFVRLGLEIYAFCLLNSNSIFSKKKKKEWKGR